MAVWGCLDPWVNSCELVTSGYATTENVSSSPSNHSTTQRSSGRIGPCESFPFPWQDGKTSLVQVITAAGSSRMPQPCHTLKMAPHNTPLYPPAPIFFLSPLLPCSLSLGIIWIKHLWLSTHATYPRHSDQLGISAVSTVPSPSHAK